MSFSKPKKYNPFRKKLDDLKLEFLDLKIERLQKWV